jgi:hypothetical protein
VLQQRQRGVQLRRGAGGVDTEGAAGFRQFSVVLLDYQRQVGITRRGEFERPLQLDLPGGALQEVGPSDDVTNTLGGVVDDDGELVCIGTIPAPDDRIPERAQVEATRTLDPIRK